MDGLMMKYFVLKPAGKLSDPYAHASRSAMKHYAELIEPENAEFARDILHWVEKEEIRGKEEVRAANSPCSRHQHRRG